MLWGCSAQLDFLFSITLLKHSASLLSNEPVFALVPGISALSEPATLANAIEQCHKFPVLNQDQRATQILLLPPAEISCLLQVPSENLLKADQEGEVSKKANIYWQIEDCSSVICSLNLALPLLMEHCSSIKTSQG